MKAYKRVAIIGGGPAGLATAKSLQLEPTQFAISVFDRRDKIGGLWYYSADKDNYVAEIPSIDQNGRDIWSEKEFDKPKFSPMYEMLETNLVDLLMEFKDLPFSPRTFHFISRTKVLEYLDEYAKTIPTGVNFHMNQQVVEVSKIDKEWVLKVQDVRTNSISSHRYDMVVVASGHNEHPYVPKVPGLEEWAQKDPKSVTHSKYYVEPLRYSGQNVLVIGNFSSGADISIQIGTVANHVYVSSNKEELRISPYGQIEYLDIIASFEFSARTATTLSGKVIPGIDAIIYCTGYLYSLPFLDGYMPGITDGFSVKNLYRQIFDVYDPSLAFVGLPKFVSPFPLSESQAAVVARVFSGRMTLPSFEERMKSYLDEFQAKIDSKRFHEFRDTDYVYCNEMFDWLCSQGTEKEGLVPIYWDSDKISLRKEVVNFKMKRFQQDAEWAFQQRKKGLTFSFPVRE